MARTRYLQRPGSAQPVPSTTCQLPGASPREDKGFPYAPRPVRTCARVLASGSANRARARPRVERVEEFFSVVTSVETVLEYCHSVTTAPTTILLQYSMLP